MAAAFRSNKDLRDALKSFFSLIEADAQPAGTMIEDVIFEKGGHFAYEVCFIESEAAETARRKAIERLTKVLGPVSSDEKDNDDLLWRIAAERALAANSMSSDQAVEKVLDELEKIAVEPRKFIGQNHAIKFMGTVADLRIGPVRAVKTTILETELEGRSPSG